MSLQNTSASERTHIAFFGRTNVGKSSIVNAITAQTMSLVSDTKGTTTDPVLKTMELLPLGPVVIIDTAGLDDTSPLGELRIQKSLSMLNRIDIGILVTTHEYGIGEIENGLLEEFKKRNLPYLIVYNKTDISMLKELPSMDGRECIGVSVKNNDNIEILKEKIASLVKDKESDKKKLVVDLLSPDDMVVLVIPIDESAPKNRLILPQQHTIRELLEHGNSICLCKETELRSTLDSLKQKPKLVITDSQVFDIVNSIVPADIPLTSFSILFARYKGELDTFVQGIHALKSLQDGDSVLISEGCTHHRQCNDIGSVKLPNWIREYTGASPRFSYSSGHDFTNDISQYKLVIHCGGCMLNEAQMKSRIASSSQAGVPIINYGIAIATMKGILERSIDIFHT